MVESPVRGNTVRSWEGRWQSAAESHPEEGKGATLRTVPLRPAPKCGERTAIAARPQPPGPQERDRTETERDRETAPAHTLRHQYQPATRMPTGDASFHWLKHSPRWCLSRGNQPSHTASELAASAPWRSTRDAVRPHRAQEAAQAGQPVETRSSKLLLALHRR
jgi:hypothetical protein